MPRPTLSCCSRVRPLALALATGPGRLGPWVATVLHWVDQKFNHRKAQIDFAHSALYESRKSSRRLVHPFGD